MEIDRNGLEVLSRHECLRLLGTATLGRIGVTSDALPTVLPVNFRFDGPADTDPHQRGHQAGRRNQPCRRGLRGR
jgi:hypothetical protein